tara:strand:+ start:1018 stop:1167 length:150 start_codon:yes stop_codon:yes gene_type:complete
MIFSRINIKMIAREAEGVSRIIVPNAQAKLLNIVQEFVKCRLVRGYKRI